MKYFAFFSVWAVLLDRCQKRLEVVIIDRSAFTSPGESRAAKTFPLVQVGCMS